MIFLLLKLILKPSCQQKNLSFQQADYCEFFRLLFQQTLSNKFYQEFEQNCQPRLGTERINRFREKIKEALKEELSIIGEDEIRMISSDVIESLFGKYKLFSEKSPLKEIRRMILTIPLATLEITRELIKQALSTIKNADVTDWETSNFGQSTLSKRKIVFNC